MYEGKEQDVILRCDNDLMKHIVDRFGEKVYTAPLDDKHFCAKVTVSLSQTFYGWVFSLGGKMKIASPEEAVNGFNAILAEFK